MATGPREAGLVGHFVAMARNNAWANHRLLNACTALSPDEFAERRTGFFPSLRATLNHILWVDIYYIGALEHDPTVLKRYDDLAARIFPTLPRCSRRNAPATCG